MPVSARLARDFAMKSCSTVIVEVDDPVLPLPTVLVMLDEFEPLLCAFLEAVAPI